MEEMKQTKQEAAAKFLRFMLSNGPTPAFQIMEFFRQRGISQRTVETAKKDAGIRSYRKDGQWFWELPDDHGRR